MTRAVARLTQSAAARLHVLEAHHLAQFRCKRSGGTDSRLVPGPAGDTSRPENEPNLFRLVVSAPLNFDGITPARSIVKYEIDRSLFAGRIRKCHLRLQVRERSQAEKRHEHFLNKQPLCEMLVLSFALRQQLVLGKEIMHRRWRCTGRPIMSSA